MKLIGTIITLFVTNLALAQNMPELKKNQTSYQKNGVAVLKLINDKSAKPENTSKELDSMVDSAVVLLKEYAKADAKASKMVNHVVTNLPKLKTISFDELQKDWHDAGALTKDVTGLDLVDEDNEKYLDPMHTLVHVLMTKAAIKKGDLQAAKEELAEGMEQYDSTMKHVK